MTSIRVMVTGRDKELLKQEPPLADSNILNLYSWSNNYLIHNILPLLARIWHLRWSTAEIFKTHTLEKQIPHFSVVVVDRVRPQDAAGLYIGISLLQHTHHMFHLQFASTGNSVHHLKDISKIVFLKRMLVFRQIYIRYASKNRQNPPLNWCCMKHWLCCWLTDMMASKAIWLSTSSEM